jgi:hypothetical protein
LVWCGLKQAKNEPNTTHVSDPHLSLGKNDRFQKRAYLACFQAENDLYINSDTGMLRFSPKQFCSTAGKKVGKGQIPNPPPQSLPAITDGTTTCLVFLSWSYFSSEIFLPWALWCTWDSESPCPMPVPLSGVSCRMAFFSRKS